jgi:hypothetical protein
MRAQQAMTPRRIGLGVPRRVGDPSAPLSPLDHRTMLRYAQLAEQLGFDSVWVPDHFFYEWPPGVLEPYPEAWTLLTAIGATQRQPDRRVDGTATWSLTTLQRSLRRSGLPQVGTSTIRRVLQDAGSSYQRTRTWCPTGTAQRKRKAGVVTVVDPNTEAKRG